jgi:hypothetical protein
MNKENMKFKYNFLARKLYQLHAEYTHEVSEDNYFRYPSGINREGFLLGENEQITFSFAQTILKVYYRKGTNSYQKTSDLPLNGEIILEFTEQDLINHE